MLWQIMIIRNGKNMPKFLKSLSFAAAIALATGATAQEAAQPASDNGLSMGQQVAPEPYIKETSGDWELECIGTGAADEPCQLLQELLGESGNKVANIRIFGLPKGGAAEAGAVIAVPLETLLTAQLTIMVDANKPRRYPFSVCDPLGCYARIGLTAEDIDAFKRGNQAIVSLVPFVAPDNRVDLKMSLKGFTDGYSKISVPAAN